MFDIKKGRSACKKGKKGQFLKSREEDCDILVLGSSGWLGAYLIPELLRLLPRSRILAAFHSRRPALPLPPGRILRISSDTPEIPEQLQPRTILHIGRGETDQDFAFHRHLIRIANERQGRYLYASSSNAVDGDVSRPHRESDRAFSRTEYGKFKGRCEEELLARCKRPLAFRFGAIHGWAPNRKARTEEFLEKLLSEEPIPVATGIRQNRLFAGDLARMIALLAAREEAEGIWHLGTSDSSEEIDFLRRLASAFGHDPARITEGDAVDWDLTLVPGKIRELSPLPREEDTIAKVAAQVELARYHKS